MSATIDLKVTLENTTKTPLTYERLLAAGHSCLHLTLKKEWYDMIASGEKKEEYREIKQYWINRLCEKLPMSVISGGEIRNRHSGQNYELKKFDRIIFKNGYSKDAPIMVVECVGITIDLGMLSWGAEKDKEYFIIQLGDVLFNNALS